MALSEDEKQYLNVYGSSTTIGGNNNNLNQIGNNTSIINNLSKEEQDFLKFTKFGEEESSVDYIRPSSGEEFDFSVYKQDDPYEIRALNQSAGEKWLNGVGRGITTALTSAAENTIGFVAGIGQLTVDAFDDQDNEGISGLANNPFGRLVDDLNNYVREELPIYYSKEEQKMNVLQSMGTHNFWADKFLNGVGYMTGAWMSGWGAGAMLNKLEQASLKSLTKEAVEEAAKKAIGSGGIANNALSNGAIGVLMAHGESSVEARAIRQNVIDRLNSEKEQGLNNLSEDEILSQANAAANVGYVLNMALVGGTDFLQFGKALTGNKIAKQVKAELTDELIEEGGQQITKTIGREANFYDKYLKGLTKGVALEGGQEMGQLAIEKGATEYYSSKYDPESNWNFLGSLKDITEAGIKNLGTNEGWESFILGALLGGGVGAVTSYGEAAEQEQRNKKGAEFINSGEYKNLLNDKDNLIRIGYYGKKEEEAALSGNTEYLQDAKSNSVNAYVQFMEENGSTDFTLKKLEQLKQTPAKDLKEFFNIPESAEFTDEIKNAKIDKQISKIKETRKDYQAIRENYPGMSKPVFDLLFDAARNLKNTTERVNSLTGEVNTLLTDFNADTLFDEKEYKSNEEYRQQFDNRVKKVYEYLNTIDPLAAKEFDNKIRGLKYLTLERRERYQKQWEEVNADPEKFNYSAQKTQELLEEINKEKFSQENYLESVQNKHFKEHTSEDNVTGFNSDEFEAEIKNKQEGYLEVEYGDTRDISKRKKIKAIRKEGEPVVSKNGQVYQKYIILDEKGQEQEVNLLNPTETQVEPSETITSKKLKYTKQRDANGYRLLVDEEGKLHRYFDVKDNLTPTKSKEEVRNDIIYEIRLKALEQINEENKKQIEAIDDLIKSESKELNKDIKQLLSNLQKQKDKVYKTLAGKNKLKNTIRRLRYKIDKSNEKINVLNESKQKLQDSINTFYDDIQSIDSESIAAGVEEIISLYNAAIENNNVVINDLIAEIDNTQKLSNSMLNLLALKGISFSLEEDTSEVENDLVFSGQKLQALEQELENYVNLNQELKNSLDRMYAFEKVYRKLMAENVALRNSIIYSNVPFTEETKKPLNNVTEIDPSVQEEYESNSKKSILNIASTTGIHFEDKDNTKLTTNPHQLRWFRALPKLVIDNTKNIFKLKIVTPTSEDGKYANFFPKELANDPNAVIGILYINNKPVSFNEEKDEFLILEEKDLNINNALFTGISEASLKNKYGSKFYDEEKYTAEELEQIIEKYNSDRQNLINLANTEKEIFVAVNAKSSGVTKNKNNRRANNVLKDETTPVEDSILMEFVDGDLNEFEIIVPTVANTTIPGIVDRILTPGIAYIKTPTGQVIPLKNNQISESLATKILEAIMFTNSENNDTTKTVKAKSEKKAKNKKVFLKKEDLSKVKDGLFEGQKVYYKKNKKYKKSKGYPYIYKKIETPDSIKQLQLKQIIDWYQSIIYFGPKTKGTNGKEFYFEKGNLYYYNTSTNKVESLDLKKGLTEAEQQSVINFIKTKYHQVNKSMLSKNDEFEAFDGLIVNNKGELQPLVIKYDSYKDYLLSNENPDGSERKTSDIPFTIDIEEKGEDTFMSSYLVFNSGQVINKEAQLSSIGLNFSDLKKTEEEKKETKFTGETKEEEREGPGNMTKGAEIKLELLSSIKNSKNTISFKIREINSNLENRKDIQEFLKTEEGKKLYNELKQQEGVILDIDEEGNLIEEQTPSTPTDKKADILVNILNAKENTTEDTTEDTTKQTEPDADVPPFKLAINNAKNLINIEKAKQWLNKKFPNLPINVIDSLIYNKAWGMATANAVYLSELAESGTEYHEGFHLAKLFTLSLNEKNILNKEASEIYPEYSEEDLESLKLNHPSFTREELIETYYEELMADDFMDYKLTGKMPERIQKYIDSKKENKSFIQKFFDLIKDFINFFSNKESSKTFTESFFKNVANDNIPINIYNKYTVDNRYKESQGLLKEQSSKEEILLGDNIYNKITSFFTHVLNNSTNNNIPFFGSEILTNDYKDYSPNDIYNKLFDFLNQQLNKKLQVLNSSSNKTQLDESIIKQINFLLQQVNDVNFKRKVIEKHKNSLKRFGIELDLEVNDENEITSKNDFADFNDSKNVKKGFTESLNPILKVYLSTIPVIDSSLNQVYDEYGLPVYKSFESVASKLGRYLAGTLNSDDVLKKLEYLQNIDAGYSSLYNELVKLDNSSELRDILLLNKFTQAFNKAEIGYNMTLVQKEGVIRHLNTSEEISAEAKIKSWKSNIKQSFNEKGSVVKDNKNNPVFALNNLKEILKSKTITNREVLSLFGIEFNQDFNIDTVPEIKDLALQLKEYFLKKAKDGITVEQLYNEEFNSRIKAVSYLAVQKEGLVENNHRGPDGETRYDLVQYNYLSKLITDYNNLPNNQNAYSIFQQEHPYLYNIYTQESELLKKGGYLFKDNGSKTNNSFNLEIAEGSKLDESGEQGDVYNSIKTPDRLVVLINNLLNNKLPFLQSSDKSLQYSLNIDLGYTEKDEKGNNIFKDFNKSNIQEKYLKHFLSAFKDEFNRVRESRIQNQIENSKYAGNLIKYYNTNSLKFSLFQNILGEEFISLVTDSVDFLNADINSNELFDKVFSSIRIKREFNNKIEEYINKGIGESIDYLTENGLLIETTNRLNQLFVTTELLPTSLNIKESLDNYRLYNTLKAIQVISTLGYIEQLKMFSGDPAFYKNLNDIFKRIPMFTGMKKNMNVTDKLNNKLNKILNRTDKKVSDGKINTLTYGDVKVLFKDYDELFDRFKKQFPKLSNEEVNSLLNPYSKEEITEADAQGFASVDEIMELMLRSGEYDLEYYKILKKIQENKNLTENEIKKVYQPYKLVYGGPGLLSNEYSEQGTLNSPTYFKYSVLPLIPSLIKGTNLELLANNMKANKIGIALFESGNKVGGLLSNNKKYKPFYKDGKFNPFDNKLDNINVIDYRYLGIQVDIADYSKIDGIMGSQVIKLISSNLASNGKFEDISVPVYNDKGIVTGLKKINSEKLQNEYDNLTEKTLQEAWVNLLDELDVVNRGNNTFVFNNLIKLKSKLKNQALQRGSSQNVIDAIESLTKEDSVVTVGIDLFPNRTKLEQILYALIKNNVVRRKALGGAKIQAAITGFENQDVVRKFSKDNTTMLSSDTFEFYREGKFGETLPMQVAISLPESMVEYVITNYGNGKIESLSQALDKFNEKLEIFFSNDNNRYNSKALEELNVDLRILQYVGYRIPTQGLNSIESIEIRKFLHPSSGDTIVVPSGIVAKSGSDFDIDKLNIFAPYFTSENNKLIYIESENDIDNNYEYASESPVEKNKLYEISKQILLAPENYTQLLTPNSSAKIKSLADEINEYYDNKEENDLSKLISWVYNSKVASNNFVGKFNVGVAALHLTTHRLFQQVGVKIKPDEYNQLLFKGLENSWSISGKMDSDNKYEILEIITQFLNAYVDIAKEPFVLDLNANTEVAGIIFYLLRRGVPVENVVYFVNQPIIKEYIKERTAEESYVKVASELTDDTKNATIYKLKSKYGKLKEDAKISPYSKEDLKSTVKPFDKLKEEEKKLQSFYLDEFVRYQEHSKELSNLMRAINQDTKFGKTKAEFITKEQVDVEKAKNLNLFEEGTLDKLHQKTLLKGFVYVHKNTPLLYKELTPLTENTVFTDIRNKIIDLIYAGNINTENRDKLINLLEQDWITYLLETSTLKNVKGGNYTISQYYKYMFDNLPRILNAIQRNNNITDQSALIKVSALIKQLVPILYNPKSKINNIQLFNKKMDSITEDVLVDSYRELKSMVDSGLITNSDYKTFINLLPLFSIAQSGLSLSPISFTDKLPVNIFTKLSTQMFDDFVKNLGDSHNTFLDEFFRNNFNNNSLVPVIPYIKQTQEGEYYTVINKDGTLTINNLNSKSNYPYLKVFIKDPKWDTETFNKKSGEKLGEYKLFRINSKNDDNSTYIEVPKQGDTMFFKEYFKKLNSSILEENSKFSNDSNKELNSNFWKILKSKKQIKLSELEPTSTQSSTQGNVKKVVEGDIFALSGIPVITTNLEGVHGAGLAQIAKNKGLIKQGDGGFKATESVVQLPVKGKMPSTRRSGAGAYSESVTGENVKLLNQGLNSLINVAKANPTKTFLLPLAGLGHGEGSIKEILPLLINTIKSTSNIQLVLPAEDINLGRQGTVRKDYTKENMPEIKEMLAQANLTISKEENKQDKDCTTTPTN